MRRAKRPFGPTLGILFFLLGASHSVFGQVDTGSINGTITDQTGAVIPGVKVTAVNEGTGFVRTTVTHEDGTYVFTPVKIGSYTVTAEFKGFQRAERVHIAVDVQQQVVVDFALQPGAVTQTVEVTTAAPLLQTQSASLGQVVASNTINDLPLNGRNFVFLAQLAAGVTNSQQDTRGEASNGRFIANGVRATQNDYLLDGIDDNSMIISYQNGHDYVVLPPIDALQEFKVQTSNYSAEFGRSAGAVLNATVKSGTNHIHGDLWEFLRNTKLDAADFFIDSAGKPTGTYIQNQFGFTIGGPVSLPHIYHGRDKTFFFGDFNGSRNLQGNPFVSTVPTAAEAASGYSDFADLIADQTGNDAKDDLGRVYPVGTIFDPATTRAVTAGQTDPVTGLTATTTGYVREAFAGNIIPVARLDQNAVKLLGVLPAPNLPGVLNNYVSDPTFTENIDSFDVRIDQNFSSHDQMFVRYSFVQDDRVRPGPFTGIADGSNSTADSTLNDRSQDSAISWTHTFSPTMVNEARFGVSREHALWLQPYGNDLSNIPGEFGIQGVPQTYENGGLPEFTIGNITRFGSFGSLPSNKFGTIPQFTENLTKIKGGHTMKFGMEIQHVNFPYTQPPQSRGVFNYTGQYTSVVNAADGSAAIGQLLITPGASSVGGIADEGGASSVGISNYITDDMSRNYLGFYAQDDWKMTHRLTVNLGVRWERYGLGQENFGAEANFIPGPPNNGAEFLVPSKQASIFPQSMTTELGTDGIALKIVSNNLALGTVPMTDFGPRLGVAFQATSKFVVRAGYGMFFGGFEALGGSPLLIENFPFEFSQSFSPPSSVQPITANNSIGLIETSLADISFNLNNVNVAGLGLIGIQYNYITPSDQDYNFTLQYQLTPNTSIQAAYVGTAGRHIPSVVGTNDVSEILPPSTSLPAYVPYPAFARGSSYTTTESDSEYNGLQLTAERRFNSGLQFLGDFTWSKCRTDSRDPLEGDVGGYRAPYIPGFGIQGDYSFCDFYVPKVIHFSGIYDLPFGAGRTYLRTSSGVVNQIVGGWSMNWILTLQDGEPFNIGCTTSPAAGVGCDALMVPGENPIGGVHDVNQWLNPSAFTNPANAASIGESSLAPLGGAPTQAIGPGFHRLDYSLFKNFRTTETTHLEFRTEVFNLTNTPNFALPSVTSFANPATFGKITATRDSPNDPRIFQFALKFYW